MNEFIASNAGADRGCFIECLGGAALVSSLHYAHEVKV